MVNHSRLYSLKQSSRKRNRSSRKACKNQNISPVMLKSKLHEFELIDEDSSTSMCQKCNSKTVNKKKLAAGDQDKFYSPSPNRSIRSRVDPMYSSNIRLAAKSMVETNSDAKSCSVEELTLMRN